MIQRHRPLFALPLLMLFAALRTPAVAPAAELEIDRSAALLAVVTHKGGFASGLGHNHLITAHGYEARFDFDPADPLATSFELEAEVKKLEVDRADLQQRWGPFLTELGVLDEAFGEVSEKDRAKIRDSMLSGKQLDMAHQTRVFARLLTLEERSRQVGTEAFTHQATLEVEVHGVEVERQVAARYRVENGRVSMDALGEFSFSEFGIQPFSTAFGAVKNLDEIHIFVHLEAELPDV